MAQGSRLRAWSGSGLVAALMLAPARALITIAYPLQPYRPDRLGPDLRPSDIDCEKAAATTPWCRTGGITTDTITRPSMYAALQDQLGLKLERRRVMTEVVIIDRLERATLD